MRRCLSRRSPPTVHLLQEVSRHVGRAVLPRLTNLNQRRIPMLMGWSMPESLAQSQEIAINCNPAKPSQHAGKAQAKGHVRAMLHDVRSAHLAGKHKKAKHRIRRYLNSHHARLVAAELARRAMKPHPQLPKALVPSIASGLDPWVGTTEEVRVNMIPKDSGYGDYRLTMDFGPENRALQHLILGALKVIADLHPHQ